MTNITETKMSLATAMQLVFTKLTRSQVRKKQIRNRGGFKVAIVTVSGLKMALGMKENTLGVFQYNPKNDKIGLLVWEMVPSRSKMSVFPSEKVVVSGDLNELGDYWLAVSTIFYTLESAQEGKLT